MTLTMFLIFLLLIAFGGLLAYEGDLLGRRLGKRRLTLFGLRPRHTAVLITTLTGCFIVALTVASVTVANEAFREWITRGDRILIALRQNEKRNLRLQEILSHLQHRYDQEQAKYNRKVAQLQDLERTLQQKITELRQKEQALAQAESKLKLERKQVVALRGERNRLQSQIANASQRIESLKARQEELRHEIAFLERQNQTYQERNTELAQRNVELERHNRELEQRNGALQTQNAEYHRQNEQIRRENEALQQAAATLRQEYEEAYVEWSTLRKRAVIFHAGEEVLRRSIQPGRSPTLIRREIRQMMEEAAHLAEQRGAAPQADGKVFFIPEKRLRGSQVRITEEESIEAVVQEIYQAKEPVVVVLVSLINVVEGEPVRAELRLFRDRQVFAGGEEIASTVLECKPSSQVLTGLLRFLKQDIRQAAIQAGLIPRLDPITRDPAVGEIGGEQLLSLLQRLSHCGTRARIIARAERDIRASEPLQLRFEIKPMR